MIAKSPTGIQFFDEIYGGTYQGRVMLVSGKSGTGKSIAALQFLSEGLRRDERCLLLSARPAEDVALYAAAYGVAVDPAIESGNLIILEYSDYVPGRDREDQLTLPPDSFVQLKQIIEEQAIQRVVLDTVLPWVAVNDIESLAEHVFSFVRVFHRLGTTSLFTLPKPASTAAFKLKKLLDDVIPVSVSLTHNDTTDQLEWNVNKYLGSEVQAKEIPYEIKPQVGLVQQSGRTDRAGSSEPQPEQRPAFSAPRPEAPPRHVPPPPPPADSGKPGKPSFSDLILREGNGAMAHGQRAAYSALPPGGTQHPGGSGWSSAPHSMGAR